MKSNEQSSSTLVFYVNGRRISLENPNSGLTLLDFLRLHLRLTGTKLGCGEGGCGACTIMISRFHPKSKAIEHFSANACLVPLCSLHGQAVTTVEGIGSTKGRLHQVQERIVKAHGSQCGFCTPGFVMSMYTLLRQHEVLNDEDLEVALQGNLCRCTGYRPIMEGFQTFTANGCCKRKGDKCCLESEDTKNQSEVALFNEEEFQPYDASQEPIFPAELQVESSFLGKEVCFQDGDSSWFRPSSLEDLLRFKSLNPDAKIIAGSTKIGIESKLKHAQFNKIVHLDGIEELQEISEDDQKFVIGSAVTISTLERKLDGILRNNSGNKNFHNRFFGVTKNGTISALKSFVRYFGSLQIRNLATIGGNLMSNSWSDDLVPILMAVGAQLTFQCHGNDARTVEINSDILTSAQHSNDILLSITIPKSAQDEFVRVYKQANRKEVGVSIVSAGMSVSFELGTSNVQSLRICFGGLGSKVLLVSRASTELAGRCWDASLLADALSLIEHDLSDPHPLQETTKRYQQTLCTSFFTRFFWEVSTEKKLSMSPTNLTDAGACNSITREPITSSQMFEVTPKEQSGMDPIGRPIVHVSAMKQASGEALYLDDIPHAEDELYLALVLSERAHAKILNIDTSAALAMDGIVGIVDNNDAMGSRQFTIIEDETIFADGEVLFHGHPIIGVIGQSKSKAQAAARLVKVTYQDLPIILTIDQAISAGKYVPGHSNVEVGDLEAAFATSHLIIEGETRTGAQEHFYMETQGCLAIPGEDNEMKIFLTTQNPTSAQTAVAQVLGVPHNRITVSVKRLGGGFGGKEMRSMALAVQVAVAAKKYGKPIRISLDRDEDMTFTGMRHPSLVKYKVGVDKDGRFLAADVTIYFNAGFSPDITALLIERCAMTSFGAYHIPNFRARGYACFTNTASNTAMRAAGIPQSYFAVETWTVQVAEALGLSNEDVRQKNLLRTGDTLPYEFTPNVQLENCWKKCLEISQFDAMKKKCEEFNRHNRWKKRGIAITNVAFPCGYVARMMNRGAVLVNIYTDGSVLISHGGIEMGQGLHTKIIQVASRELNISSDRFYIAETSTDKVPNTMGTSGSTGTDLNASALIDACKKLRERLASFRKSNPDGSWEDIVKEAFQQGVSLSATGYFFDSTFTTQYTDTRRLTGRVSNYFSYGSAFSEVEIDCLTGDHVVRQVHIVMDIGYSLNPAIDIGQIEGAYMQGYGLLTMEEIRYSTDGKLLTSGPGAYKIPGFGDVPRNFTVHLLHGARCEHPHAVYSSKAVGEPPLLLSVSTFAAIREAIKAARADNGLHGFFRLDAPATCERIRMSCGDNLVEGEFANGWEKNQIS